MNEFFSWTTLATFAGCATATAVITQFIKETKPLKNIATQWVSYGIALILLYAATYFTSGLTGPVAALIPFNAILIALAANGAYAAITRVNQATTANDADGDIPVGAASGENVTVEQQDVTPTTFNSEAEARAAFPGIDNVTAEQIDKFIDAINILIGKVSTPEEQAQAKEMLAALNTLKAAKATEGGASASDTTGAV